MKPFVYELKRVLTSKTVLIIMILMIVVSLGLGYGLKSSLASQNTSPAQTGNVIHAIYYSNDTFHGIFSCYNGYGLPIAGVVANFTIFNTSFEETTMSNAQGLVNFTLPSEYANTNPVLGWNFSYPSQYTYTPASVFQQVLNNNSVQAPNLPPYYVLGTYYVSAVPNPHNPTEQNLHIFYVGPNGTASPNVYLYYQGVPGATTSSSGSVNLSNMTEYGTIGGFYSTNINLNLPKNSNYSYYNVAIVSNPLKPNTGVSTVYFNLRLLNKITVDAANELFFVLISPIMSYLVPLMAILVGYLTYGKDRASGVLESVLVRPVTRVGALSSRYIATVAAVLVATGVSILLVDLFMDIYFGTFLSSNFVLQVIWGLFVEAAAFIGIVYILSHLMRSQGGILGIGIALYFVLVLFWSLISLIIIAELFHGITGTAFYSHAQVIMFYINPGSYMTLMRYVSLISFGASVTNLASYGITAVNVAIAGVLWILVPVSIAMYLAKRRD